MREQDHTPKAPAINTRVPKHTPTLQVTIRQLGAPLVATFWGLRLVAAVAMSGARVGSRPTGQEFVHRRSLRRNVPFRPAGAAALLRHHAFCRLSTAPAIPGPPTPPTHPPTHHPPKKKQKTPTHSFRQIQGICSRQLCTADLRTPVACAAGPVLGEPIQSAWEVVGLLLVLATLTAYLALQRRQAVREQGAS